MFCTQLAKNTGCKNYTKKLPSAHHCIDLSGYIFATKACTNNREKTIEQQYLRHMSSQYGDRRSTNG